MLRQITHTLYWFCIDARNTKYQTAKTSHITESIVCAKGITECLFNTLKMANILQSAESKKVVLMFS